MLHLHRAPRADALVDALAAQLEARPADPFAAEVVSVPTRGMERWLAQRLGDRLGVCANVDFPSPRRLVADAVAAASGVDPETDPWRAELAVWPLLETVEAHLGEPWLATLAAHLGTQDANGDGKTAEHKAQRRFAVVRHLASLFERYALHRPEMVRAWAAGDLVTDTGDPLPDRHTWQAELWQPLRAHLGTSSPAERFDQACAALRDPAQARNVDLPPRIALFGLTRLPAGERDVLEALAATRDVHLFLLHPSPALWTKVTATLENNPPPTRQRAHDPTTDVPANRLLASWGRDVRELQLVTAPTTEGTHHEDHPHEVEDPPDTLLGHLQRDIRDDRQPGADDAPLLDPDDRSLEIHACHGPSRQVEVLRDAVLHLLEDDPTLEPRDVVVMCPDIETFAPLIHATFGLGEALADDPSDTDPHAQDPAAPPPPQSTTPKELKVRLADRALRQTNPLLGVVARLLELAGSRVTASETLDLLDREPVRRRFGLDDDDVARVEDWVAESGVRWGVDAPRRAPFKLENVDANTWRSGLDRVLTGVALTEQGARLHHGVLPVDDIESGAIDLAGRLAEAIDRLTDALDRLDEAQSTPEWLDAIAHATDALTATAPAEAWQRVELDRLLGDLADEAQDAITPLKLREVQALLADRLQGRPTRANFRTGHLTICTLMPMRSIPHRVVCLLGMDDGVFPRKGFRDGDDLTLNDPHIGDRDPRAEDRQLLLDALMAAGDRLLITYSGNDERTNLPRPPAVPIGELLDAVDRTVRTDDGRPAGEHLTTRHPLQPFNPDNFAPGALHRDRPWSFDRTTLAGARALEVEDRPEPAPLLAEPLPPHDVEVVQLDDLVAFAEHPARAFLRQRLGVHVREWEDELEDALPLELSGLAKWKVGERMLRTALEGRDVEEGVVAARARGSLPPGRLAEPVLDEIRPRVELILQAASGLPGHGGEPASQDVRLRLPDGRRLAGTVAGLHGDVLRTVTYSSIKPGKRLAPWVRFLALTAADPERPVEAVTVGRSTHKYREVATACLPPLAGSPNERRDGALRHLSVIVDLWLRGMREPLPLVCGASAGYAEAVRADKDPVQGAHWAWTSSYNYPKEDQEPEHLLVFGGRLEVEDLCRGQDPAPDERGPGWEEAETTRFGRLARRLWDPLLDHEDLRHR